MHITCLYGQVCLYFLICPRMGHPGDKWAPMSWALMGRTLMRPPGPHGPL